VKKLCIELQTIKKLFEILRNNSSNSEVQAVCCRALNQFLSEVTDTTQPSKKDLVGIIVDAGGLTEAINMCGLFISDELVIEQWFPIIDACLDSAAKLDSVGTIGMDKILQVIQKHRFVIQVTGVSILSKLCDSDDYAKHLIQVGGIPVLVKVLATESNLSKYEQRSREACIKCLNKLATYQEGIERIRPTGLPKVLDAAMRGYGTFFIIQIQGILLIKALLRDDEMKRQLLEANVVSLLNFSASKHTVTRLQNIVKDLKELLGVPV